jgi:hypothetical protein
VSCLLTLNPFKHNAYCVYQLHGYAEGLHLPVNCICGNVCDSQNKHNLFSLILAAFTGHFLIALKMLKQANY